MPEYKHALKRPEYIYVRQARVRPGYKQAQASHFSLIRKLEIYRGQRDPEDTAPIIVLG